jgi:DNA polymerase III alpha subunit (gram-positive type)
MSGYVIYVNDTETTGLMASEKKGLEILDDVIEISMLRLQEKNGKYEKDQKTWYLKPLNPAVISDEALRVNKHKKEDILWLTEYGRQTYREPKDVLPEIELWMMEDEVSIKDRIFVGQNPNFDINALEALWEKMNCKNSFPFDLNKGDRVLDTKQIALLVDLCCQTRRDFYNLGSLVKAFGITKRTAHRAEGDTQMTADLLMKILEVIMPILQENFGKNE